MNNDELLEELNRTRTTKQHVLEKVVKDSDELYLYGKGYYGKVPPKQLTVGQNHPLHGELDFEKEQDVQSSRDQLVTILSDANPTETQQLKNLILNQPQTLDSFRSNFKSEESFESFQETFEPILVFRDGSIEVDEDVTQNIEELIGIESEVF
ncbi:MAG: hypothetical protein ABEH43_06540 [Flavobacteriales bacterium]